MAKSRAEFEGASAADVATPEDPVVICRVLKAGDGKISTGVHGNRGGEELYEFKEEFAVAKSIALALEARHYVEIQDEPAKK